jgi:thiamine-phosphate pyrophosphorylase
MIEASTVGSIQPEDRTPLHRSDPGASAPSPGTARSSPGGWFDRCIVLLEPRFTPPDDAASSAMPTLRGWISRYPEAVRGPPQHLQLYLLFTPGLCRHDAWWTLEEAIAGGVDLVQWRVKDRDRDGLDRCLALCATHGVPVVVNDDVELAAATDAAGAHVGQHDLPPAEARRRLRRDQWLGVSTHDVDEFERAITAGADHVGFGPMFATTTKGYAAGQPQGALRAILGRAPVPVYAIGGITADNVGRVLGEGATRIAVSAAILATDDPRAAARALASCLREQRLDDSDAPKKRAPPGAT